jgi:TNF receptor-associated factor 2/TNF receptor-associated factor 3
MSEHYKTEQHQTAIITFIRRDLSKFANDQPEGASGMDVDTLSHTTTSLSDNSNSQLQEVCETIDVLAGGIQALNEDAQRLSDESVQLQNQLEALTKDFAGLKLSIQEQSTYLDGLKPNQEILHQDISSLKQKVEDLQFISYDGSLTWKISNFAEKMGEIFINKIHSHHTYFYFLVDAQSERQTSIYSPPFYSSPTGYKMRSRLYLHGDGNARRTHMSLFFVLMRSEYDAILKFPFNYKVTFCLYDQTPAQRHIIDSFRPDIKSNSFQRPRSEMNIASGIPKFFPLAMIQQEGNPYVRDNTIFIKVMVDFGDMPKTILPYALSLNPGLPTNVQQNMIKQETEKRTQQTPTS